VTVIAWYGSSFAYYDEEPQTDEERDAAAVLTRYSDVAAVLRDAATFSSAVVPQVPPRDRDMLAEFTEWSARWLFFLDPPQLHESFTGSAQRLPRRRGPLEYRANHAVVPARAGAARGAAAPDAARRARGRRAGAGLRDAARRRHAQRPVTPAF
jgi:hypothetical protein